MMPHPQPWFRLSNDTSLRQLTKGGCDMPSKAALVLSVTVLVLPQQTLGRARQDAPEVDASAPVAAGVLDPTFDGDGRQTVDFGADDRAHAVVVQPDGK